MNRIGRSRVRAAVSKLLVMALLVLAACDPSAPEADGTLVIEAIAGPTCPVETDPPDPDCAPRAVAGAPIVVSPADGRDIVVAQGETDADGRLTLAVPPGEYIVTAGDVEGLMGTPDAVPVLVADGGETTTLLLPYDTGIR